MFDEEATFSVLSGAKAQRVMDCSKADTFLKKTDYHGSDIIKGGVKGVTSSTACCKACSTHATCKYDRARACASERSVERACVCVHAYVRAFLRAGGRAGGGHGCVRARADVQ